MITIATARARGLIIPQIFGAEGIPQDTGSSLAKAIISNSATAFVQSHLGVDPAHINYKSGLDGGAGKFAYLKQAWVSPP